LEQSHDYDKGTARYHDAHRRAGAFRDVRTSGPEPGLSRVSRSRSVTSSGAQLAGAAATFAGRASR